jgi:hypothetical protein
MEKKETKPLKEQLLETINKVLKDNKTNFTTKIEKVVKKSIRRIVKKTDNQIKNALNPD